MPVPSAVPPPASRAPPRGLAEGLLANADFAPGQTEAGRKYAGDYRKEYNEEYDGLNILVSAIRKAGEDRDKFREAILASQGYMGVLGSLSFTPNGDGLSEVSVIQIEKGKPKLLTIVKVERSSPVLAAASGDWLSSLSFR